MSESSDASAEGRRRRRPNQIQVIGPDGNEVVFGHDILDGDFLGEDLSDDEDDDFLDDEVVDIKEAFDLPDSLPPLRLPPEGELAAAARDSRLLERARQLGQWVGETPRQLTDDGDLSGADAAAAAQALMIAPDGPDLPLLWELAEELDFIASDGSFASTGPGIDDWPDSDDEDVLEVWEHALAVSMAEALPIAAELANRDDLDFDGVGVIALVVLFLARAEGIPVTELSELIQEPATGELPPDQAHEAWRSWTAKHGDPAEALLACLAELGGATVEAGVATLSPLASHAMRLQLLDSGVEVPLLPPVDEMTAAQLVALGKTADPPELAAESAAWLAARSADVAAAELLAVARAGGPAERLFATAIASDAGPGAEAQWRRALDEQALRPYAKMALTTLAGGTEGEVLPGLEPTLSDLAWMLTDTIAGLAESVDLDQLDPDQRAEHTEALAGQVADSVPPEHAEQLFEELRRLDHPGAYTALTEIGRHHPDKRTAKAARRAAHKLRTATKR